MITLLMRMLRRSSSSRIAMPPNWRKISSRCGNARKLKFLSPNKASRTSNNTFYRQDAPPDGIFFENDNEKMNKFRIILIKRLDEEKNNW